MSTKHNENPTNKTVQADKSEPVWTGENLKPLKPLTRKQAAFVKHLVDNPKASATAAIKATYGKPDKPVSDTTAAVMATENLRKPNILLELSKHSHTAENSLLTVMNVSTEYAKDGDKAGAAYASVAVSAANSILDRLHGKATQRIEQRTEAVVISIDLTGVADAPAQHTEK